MARRKKYVVTGRYMNGREVVGYHIVSNDGEQRKVSREQFVYLLGRGDIANCTGQMYKDRIIIRGLKGTNIEDLPVLDERTGEIRNTKQVTNVRPRGGDATQVFEQLILTARLMNGRENIGFEVKNRGGQVARLPREQVIELAEKKLIANAVVQNLNTKNGREKLLRGAGVDLRSLPVINVDKRGIEVSLKN